MMFDLSKSRRRSGLLGLVALLGVAPISFAGLGCSGDDNSSATDGGASVDATHATGDATTALGSDASPEASGDGAAVDSSDGAAIDAGPPPAPAVRLIGRFDESDASDGASAVAEWSGSAIAAHFSGTSVAVHLDGQNFFAVLVDGALRPVLATKGDAVYPIATGLTPGSHDVLVFRRDEAFDQPMRFQGFDFGDGGALLPPLEAPKRRIEIIGDSISCGFGNECAKASDAFSAATENEYIAYGPLTARAFNADVHVVAWSGKGMYRNLDGTLTETVPILWQRTIPTDATSHWDPSRYVPDAVVINLGTNDFNASGADPAANYQATYLTFVTQLRGVYPNAFIFAGVGPMVGGTKYTEIKTAITNVIAARKTAGDANLALVEFPTQDCGADGTGCGCASHPNAAEHQKMATLLQAAMHTALGW